MKKRIISVLLALFMVLGLFPATASAYYAFDVFVDNTDVSTEDTTYWISDGSGGITSVGADASNYVVKFQRSGSNVPELTLNGVNITGTDIGIYAEGDLNIYLADGATNIVNASDYEYGSSYGMYVSGSLWIHGSGSLLTSGDNTASTSCGMYASNSVLFGDSVIVNATGKQAGESYGIQALLIMINGGTVTANSTATIGTAQAMSMAPSIMGSSNSVASTNGDGNVPIAYDSNNIDTYKYLRVQMIIDPNIAAVNTAKSILENGTYTMTQATANTSDNVKTELARQINALSGMSATGINAVTAGDISFSSFTPAVAGTSGNTAGTNGSFTFNVSLTKGTVNQTTLDKTGTITATEGTAPIPLTGTVTISGTPKFGQTLTATYGPGNSTGTLSYQWKRGATEIGTNSNTYTLVESDINQTITCEVASTEQTGSVTSNATTAITKADGPAVSGVAAAGCTNTGNNDGKLTGVTAAMEYRKAGTGLYNSGNGSDITGLTPDNYLVRVKETTTHTAGAYTNFYVGQYWAAPLTGTVTISGTTKFGQTLTATYTSGNSTGTLSYQWKRGATDIGSDSNTYTLVESDINQTITCEVKSTEQIGSVTSNATTAIAKADGPAVTGVGTVSCTNTGNNDGKLTGVTTTMEYKKSGAASYISGSGSDITGLTNGTYLARVKATTTHNAGADSTFTVGAYVPAPLTGTVTISGTTKFGQTLTATYTSGNSTGTLSYQWKRGATDIGTDSNTYTLVEADINQTITCEVKSTEQAGSVTSNATTAIARADGPAVTGVSTVSCTNTGNNNGKLTGVTTAMEYKKSGAASYISGSGSDITGLTNGTYLVRVRATTTYNAGADSTFTVGAYVPNPLIGTVTISGTTKFAQTLTATYTSGNSTGTLSYQWKRGATNIGTDSNTYTLVEADINQTITCEVKSTEQTGSVTSNATTAITKADGPAVTGVGTVGCTNTDNNDGKLTGVTTAIEYKKSGAASYISGNGSDITGLTNGTYLVRVKATTTHNAGADSTFTVGAYVPAQLTGTVTISGTTKFAQTLTATYTSGNSTGTLSYQWKRGATDIGTDSNTYTLVEADINTTITCEVASTEQAGSVISIATTAVAKADGPVVTGVGTVGCTNTGNNDGKLTGVTTAMEYKKSGAASYISGSGSDITDLTNGTYLVRVKATTTHNAGAGSTFTIGAYVPSSNGSDNGFSGINTPIMTEGKIEKDQKREENAPTANLNDSIENLKLKVLSAEEQTQVATGKDAKVILKIEDISASVSDEDKKQIEQKLEAEQQNAADTALLYIDISLYKKIGDEAETRVTETSGKISISIQVPENMWNTNTGVDRSYRVIRVHNGVAEVLEGTYDPVTHLFTFETDRFSTYALTYQDLNNVTVETDESKATQPIVYQDFNHLRLTAKASKTSQKLSYAKVSGADGYFIYGAQCGQNMKMLAEVEGTVSEYTVKKLKQATYYQYQVKAYKNIDNEKVILMTSKVIHSVTEGKNYANPSKLTSDTASVKLAAGETKTVICQVVLPKGKKLKSHTAAIRYESSDKTIATVSSQGKITARTKGTCYVYAYAQNGVYKMIRVTVE